MLIAVMGDSHDHRKSMGVAVELAVKKEAKVLFHLGDLISPFMLTYLNEFPGMIYLVIGNNDGDQLAVSRTIPQECPQIREYSRFISVDIDNTRIGAMHYPDHARAQATSGNFDIVLCGHTHQFSETMIGDTLLLNPGDLYGLKEEASFCLVDTETKEVKRLFVSS